MKKDNKPMDLSLRYVSPKKYVFRRDSMGLILDGLAQDIGDHLVTLDALCNDLIDLQDSLANVIEDLELRHDDE